MKTLRNIVIAATLALGVGGAVMETPVEAAITSCNKYINTSQNRSYGTCYGSYPSQFRVNTQCYTPSGPYVVYSPWLGAGTGWWVGTCTYGGIVTFVGISTR